MKTGATASPAYTRQALERCLDVLVRMDPNAVSAGRLQPCTDPQFNAAVAGAAAVIHGSKRSAWPAPVLALLQRKE
jgi:hypothetical protein